MKLIFPVQCKCGRRFEARCEIEGITPEVTLTSERIDMLMQIGWWSKLMWKVAVWILDKWCYQ